MTEDVNTKILATQETLQKAVTSTDNKVLRPKDMAKGLRQEYDIESPIGVMACRELIGRLAEDCKAAVTTKKPLEHLILRLENEKSIQEGTALRGHSIQSGVVDGGVHGAHFGIK